MSFKITDETIENLKSQSAFEKLATSRKKGEAGDLEIEEGKRLQGALIEALEELKSNKVYKNRDEFIKLIKNAFKTNGLNIAAALLKSILQALGEKDETAEVCKNTKGEVEADSDLKDTENVALKDNITEYMKREVLPHVPDAWVDESKTKVGYEIPFTRHFYKYTPLRSSEIIMEDIKGLEMSIADRLKNLLG